MRKIILIIITVGLMYNLLFSQGLITGSDKRKFVPPDKVLFEEDFTKCPVGEPPVGFDKFSGAGECIKYENQIWLAPVTDSDYKIYKKINLGSDEFSIEFDFLSYQDRGVTDLVFRLLESRGDSWDKARAPYDLEIYDSYKTYTFKLEGVGEIGKIKNAHRKKVHVAIQVRRKQLRIYANGKRLTVVPFQLTPKEHISGFEFMFIRDTNKYGAFITNIKVGKYLKPEAIPAPEKLGIKIEKFNEKTKITIPEKVLFDFNKFFLKSEAKKALQLIGKILKKNPDKKILIIGYTDNIGSDEYNMLLSLQRAQSVADYLIYVENIDKNRIKIIGKGKANPIATNSTEEGRAKNRRVEIILK